MTTYWNLTVPFAIVVTNLMWVSCADLKHYAQTSTFYRGYEFSLLIYLVATYDLVEATLTFFMVAQVNPF
jgi:hypothetical protein